MNGDLAVSIGAGLGVFTAIILGITVVPKFQKWLREWEPFKKKED